MTISELEEKYSLPKKEIIYILTWAWGRRGNNRTNLIERQEEKIIKFGYLLLKTESEEARNKIFRAMDKRFKRIDMLKKMSDFEYNQILEDSV